MEGDSSIQGKTGVEEEIFEDLDEDAEEEIQALPPVVISGSYLTCTYVREQNSQKSTVACSLPESVIKDLDLNKVVEVKIEGEIYRIHHPSKTLGKINFKIKIVTDKRMSHLIEKVEEMIEVDTQGQPVNKEVSTPVQAPVEPPVEPEPVEPEPVEPEPVIPDPAALETPLEIPKFSASFLEFRSTTTQKTAMQLQGYSDSGNPVSYIITKYPQYGVISSFNAQDGSFIYEPVTSFVGTTELEFKLKEGEFLSETFVANIVVMEFSVANTNFKTIKNQNKVIQLQGSLDGVNHPLVYEIVQAPTYGTITDFDELNGSFTYKPLENSVGPVYMEFRMRSYELNSGIFTATIEIIESDVILDRFERGTALNNNWISSKTWDGGNGLKIYDRNDEKHRSLYMFGKNTDTQTRNSIRVISEFKDLSNFSSSRISMKYILNDIGDFNYNNFDASENMTVRICVKSSAAECGVAPKDNAKLKDQNIWIEVFRPHTSKLNNLDRNCRSNNWSTMTYDLHLNEFSNTYPDFRSSKVSIMISAENLNAGMEAPDNLHGECNDAVIIDDFSLKGVHLTPQ